MPMDKFFNQDNCDRCHKPLMVRTMSWFNEDTICPVCSDKESEIRKKLPNAGKDYEGCGYIPNV